MKTIKNKTIKKISSNTHYKGCLCKGDSVKGEVFAGATKIDCIRLATDWDKENWRYYPFLLPDKNFFDGEYYLLIDESCLPLCVYNKTKNTIWSGEKLHPKIKKWYEKIKVEKNRKREG